MSDVREAWRLLRLYCLSAHVSYFPMAEIERRMLHTYMLCARLEQREAKGILNVCFVGVGVGVSTS